MEILKERILQDGRALSETVLKVDSFLNHGVDARLMYEIGTYFKEYYKNHYKDIYYWKFRYCTNCNDSYANGASNGYIKKAKF